ncbi:MAG: DUF951 domain-containing protein [Clostridia bacterium]|nr:DUF951 domain-containing protein [Clostridia bacterium]
MDIRVEDVIKMKKCHPCGSDRFLVLRTGMDLRLQCLGCGRILFLPRIQVEKQVRSLIRKEDH